MKWEDVPCRYSLGYSSNPADQANAYGESVQKMDTTSTNPKDLLGASKVPLSKIPPIALLHLAMAMAEGAAKYGAFNWRDKAVQADIYIDATMRHLLAWADGEELSPDAQIHHLGHAMASLAILLDAQATGCLVDNRPKNGRTGEFLEKLNAQLKQKREKK